MSAPVTTAAAPRIRSRVPSTRILHAINPFVSAILRSPLHALLSKEGMLLRFAGRKSGNIYTVPVGYLREGDMFTIMTVHPWWKNLRDAATVSVRLQGQQRTGRAEAIEDRQAVLGEVAHLVERYGPRTAGRRIGIALGTTPPPSSEEHAQAMRGRVVIRMVLEP